MKIARFAEQKEDNRWGWVVVESDDGVVLNRIEWSIVSFASKADADQDLAEHTMAPRDTSGRRIRSKEQLQHLIRAASEACEDCADAYFGGVYWHEPDDAGCNWSISTMGGNDWKGCLECIQLVARELRANYSIAEEG
jgi:hypothetical protein